MYARSRFPGSACCGTRWWRSEILCPARHAARSAASQMRDPGFCRRATRMPYFVYILASRYKGTLYVGVTRDLSRRVEQHRGGAVAGFTRQYKVHRLVYFEQFESILEARARERVLKRW